MIHIVVELVRKSCVVVLDVDWLHRAVHGVGIKRVNQELSYLSVLTEVSVPRVLLDTCITGNTLVVTYNLEDCIGERRFGSSRKGGAFELDHSVLRGSAREVTTISRVGPTTRRFVDMGYSVVMHIIEDSVFEVLDVNVVRSVSVGTHAVLPRCATLDLYVVEIMEGDSLEHCVMFPDSSRLHFVYRKGGCAFRVVCFAFTETSHEPYSITRCTVGLINVPVFTPDVDILHLCQCGSGFSS